MKTLEECKDEVAETIYGHNNWREFRSDGMDWRVYEDAHDMVAEAYAEQFLTRLKELEDVVYGPDANAL